MAGMRQGPAPIRVLALRTMTERPLVRSTVRTYIAVGANLGDAQAHVHAALHALETVGSVQAVSHLYRTAPHEAIGPDYVNAVACVDTAHNAVTLLRHLQALEAAAGRQRSTVNAPRTLDLDVLLFGRASVWSPTLTIPHPRMWTRAFVLYPLRDVAPHLVGDAHLAQVAGQPITRL